MSLKPISKPFTPRPKRPVVAPVPVESPPEPTPTPTIEHEACVAEFEPRVLTFEEVCRYLNLRPELRKLFVNKKGEYVRKQVEEYTWTIDQDKRVHKIPKWFFNNEAW